MIKLESINSLKELDRAYSKGKRKTKYKRVLKSYRWKKLRQKVFKIQKNTCKGCGVKKSLELHHLHYSKLGREREKDVLPLCGDCHLWITIQTQNKPIGLKATLSLFEGKKMDEEYQAIFK